MKSKRIRIAAASVALAAPVTLAAAGPARADVPSPATFTDATGDGSSALDLRSVRVKNTERRVVVRLELPGAAKAPLGGVAVFLDTDPGRAGAEYGHFADFGSEYRFAPVRGWREQRMDDCAGDGRLRIDPTLRTITFKATKRPGCLEGDSVRVAVMTVDDSGAGSQVDWLGSRRSFSEWVS